MKISLWSQFSSNHSARFTVVGVFETPAAAERAVAELDRLFKAIDDWFNDPAHEETLVAAQWGTIPPIPPELAAAEHYGIEWTPHSIDWGGYPAEESGAVIRLEHVVFINGRESGLGARPADDLLRQLGATALVDGSRIPIWEADYDERLVTVDLECQAPDEQVAQRIVDEHRQYFERRKADPGIGSSMLAGSVQRDGSHITFTGLSFWPLATVFPQHVGYLKDKGCTQIRYQFMEQRVEPGGVDEE